jgi:hypothetical protein
LSLIVRHGELRFAASHIAARGFSPGHSKALVHSLLCRSARFGHQENAAMNCSTIMRAKNANGAEWNAQR